MPEFTGRGTPLSQEGIAAACAVVGVEPPALWAVMSVETSGCGFLADRRPKILFERHLFSRSTDGHFDTVDPDVSNPTSGGYGPGGPHQYERLVAAMDLDRNAALQSASWGLGQILGENFAAAGFDNVSAMVDAMVVSEDAQLAAMAKFIASSGMDAPLREQNWQRFARRYNGPDFAANNYDGLLQDAFHRFSTGDPPDLQVRQVQVLLTYQGLSPGSIDGRMGVHTADAIRAFQQANGANPTGAIDAGLIAALSM